MVHVIRHISVYSGNLTVVLLYLSITVANKEELVNLIRCLGTQNRRAERLITFSRTYLLEPPSMYDMRPRRVSSPRKTSPFFAPSKSSSLYPATPISHIPGTGLYALDSYRIFSSCHEDPGSEEWKNVMPHDKELVRFLVGYDFSSQHFVHSHEDLEVEVGFF